MNASLGCRKTPIFPSRLGLARLPFHTVLQQYFLAVPIPSTIPATAGGLLITPGLVVKRHSVAQWGVAQSTDIKWHPQHIRTCSLTCEQPSHQQEMWRPLQGDHPTCRPTQAWPETVHPPFQCVHLPTTSTFPMLAWCYLATPSYSKKRGDTAPSLHSAMPTDISIIDLKRNPGSPRSVPMLSKL